MPHIFHLVERAAKVAGERPAVAHGQNTVLTFRELAAQADALAGYLTAHLCLASGDRVALIYPAANRDPAVFTDPDRFDVHRDPNPHVAFGFGVHRCMGNRLAEMQLQVLWEEIMKRFQMVEVVGDIERLPNNFIRGIKEVPVRLHPL